LKTGIHTASKEKSTKNFLFLTLLNKCLVKKSGKPIVIPLNLFFALLNRLAFPFLL